MRDWRYYEDILIILIDFIIWLESTELIALTETLHYEPFKVIFYGISNNVLLVVYLV